MRILKVLRNMYGCLCSLLRLFYKPVKITLRNMHGCLRSLYRMFVRDITCLYRWIARLCKNVFQGSKETV